MRMPDQSKKSSAQPSPLQQHEYNENDDNGKGGNGRHDRCHTAANHCQRTIGSTHDLNLYRFELMARKFFRRISLSQIIDQLAQVPKCKIYWSRGSFLDYQPAGAYIVA